MGNTPEKQAAPARTPDHYVVVHTMISVPQPVRDDPALSQLIDAHFLVRGDVVSEEMLGGTHPRLLRIGAIRAATTDEAQGAAVIRAPRRSTAEADAEYTAALGTTADPHAVAR